MPLLQRLTTNESEIHLVCNVALRSARMRIDESKIFKLLPTKFKATVPVDGELWLKDETASEGGTTADVFKDTPEFVDSLTERTMGMLTLRCVGIVLQWSHDAENHRTLLCEVIIILTLGLVPKTPKWLP